MAKKKRPDEHEYPESFENVYTGIHRASNGQPKLAAYMMFCRMKRFYESEITKIKKDAGKVNCIIDNTYIQ